VLPHQDAAWKIIKERLDALEQTCAALGRRAGLSALAPIADKLHSMSQDIAAHIPNTTAEEQARMCLQAGSKSCSTPSRSSMPCPITQLRPYATTALVPYRPARVAGAGSG